MTHRYRCRGLAAQSFQEHTSVYYFLQKRSQQKSGSQQGSWRSGITTQNNLLSSICMQEVWEGVPAVRKPLYSGPKLYMMLFIWRSKFTAQVVLRLGQRRFCMKCTKHQILVKRLAIIADAACWQKGDAAQQCSCCNSCSHSFKKDLLIGLPQAPVRSSLFTRLALVEWHDNRCWPGCYWQWIARRLVRQTPRFGDMRSNWCHHSTFI